MNRALVIQFLLLFLGGLLIVIALRHGFGLNAAWYWWVILGAGLGAFVVAIKE